jgi:hypothetical protein
LWAEIPRVFQPAARAGWTISVSEHNRNKIQAIRTLHVAFGFWSRWETFTPIIQALNNNVPRFDILQRPSVAQMISGVDTANMIRREVFVGDVAPFAAACALDDGVCWLPEPLGFVNDSINPLLYYCKECGNQDELDEDGYCDNCSLRFDKIKNLDLKPDEVRKARGHGRDLVTGYKYDWEPVRARYGELVKVSADEVHLREDDSTDTQVAKLLVAKEYMGLRRRQVIDQVERLGEWAKLR